jgi:uncharacterized protein with NAD-binding domain and iron-sulfur cluster
VNTSPPVSLAIIGGGLAGMTAALSARERGFSVALFEQDRFLGGRVNSREEDWNGQILDAGPHIALGCCTRFLDFCRRLEIDAFFRRVRTLHFLEGDGHISRLSAAPLVPAPWHLMPSLLRMKSLSLGERWQLVRTLKRLVSRKGIDPISRNRLQGATAGLSSSVNYTGGQATRGTHAERESLGDWLRSNGASDQAIRCFWSLVVQHALGETIDFVTLPAAEKVFEECFFASRHGYEILLPQRPWRELLDERAGSRLAQCGVEIQRRRRVMWIESEGDSAFSVVFADGVARPFDAVVLAVPWHQAAPLVSGELAERMPQLSALSALEPGAIAAVHLWFDRPILPVSPVVLQSRLAPWIFAAPMHFSLPAEESVAAMHYYQAVVSAAHRVAPSAPREIRDLVLGELREFLPPARAARLLHARELLHPRAVFSPQPGSERLRPPQKTPVARLVLSGDWTATGWPATMESAVRSGFLAAEELSKSLNDSGFRTQDSGLKT